MSDLVEFLLARVDEDEAVARRVQGRTRHEPPPTIGGIGDVGLVGYPYRRALAECEAKRRVVEESREYSPELAEGDNGAWAFDLVLRALALPYAEHPDFREEWRL